MDETDMYSLRSTNPRQGQRVQVETLGTVVGLEERAGVDGALVDVDDNADPVWFPLRFVISVGLG